MTTWRKSSRSTNTDNCVEIANSLDQVRDSKNMAVSLRADVRRLIDDIRADRISSGLGAR